MLRRPSPASTHPDLSLPVLGACDGGGGGGRGKAGKPEERKKSARTPGVSRGYIFSALASCPRSQKPQKEKLGDCPAQLPRVKTSSQEGRCQCLSFAGMDKETPGASTVP